MKKDNRRVCPVEGAGGLDNWLRKLLQNPQKILSPYIREEMTVLDLGCGPGFFSIEIARMLNGQGKMIAADLQQGMLDIVRRKITETQLNEKIVLHKCRENRIGLEEKVDFAVAFYVVHEIPDHNKFFEELKTTLKPGGQLFICEPKFHVSKKSFKTMANLITNKGYKIISRPRVFFSRAILVKNT